MFHESIGANLRYGRPEATDDEVMAAADAAQIRGLVESLPHGLDTLVDARGYRLSGGEKQRLAIARMLLKDPANVTPAAPPRHHHPANRKSTVAAPAVSES